MNMKPIFRRRSKADQKAQGMVEFALILPILLLMIFGIIEFGRLMFIYASVASASREAVRYGSAVDDTSGLPRYADCAGIRAAAKRIGDFAGVQDADIYINYDNGIAETIASCAGITDLSDIELGDRVVVSVSADYAPIVLFANIPSFPITSTSARTIIKSVRVEGTPPPPPPPMPSCGLELLNFSFVGNEAQWTIKNNADSDAIIKIEISFESLGNLIEVLSKLSEDDPIEFHTIWDGADDPKSSPAEISIFIGEYSDIVIGEEISKDFLFKFDTFAVPGASNKFDLTIYLENCGTLEHH